MKTHPSYGTIAISEHTCSPPTKLVGSAVKHSKYITLTISTGEKVRDFGTTSMHSKNSIVKVSLSPLQFAELLTSQGRWCGVECTIASLNGKKVEMEKNPTTEMELLDADYDKEVDVITSRIGELKKLVHTSLTGSFLKKDKANLKNLVDKLVQDVEENIPYLRTLHNESIEKTIHLAKKELEAFVRSGDKEGIIVPSLESSNVDHVPYIETASVDGINLSAQSQVQLDRLFKKKE